jgi:hypothetical protein
MGTIFLIVGAAFLLSWIPALAVFFVVRGRYRGDRIIACPETGRPEAVRLDARRAAVSSLVGPTKMRLEWCSRWPERRDCGQECLAQIEGAADGCLVRARLESWYSGARCCLCGDWFGRIQWFDRKPGLRAPDGNVFSWEDVASEDLPEILATHRPLCFNCLVAETFRRRFPDRVVENPIRLVKPARRDGPRSVA